MKLRIIKGYFGFNVGGGFSKGMNAQIRVLIWNLNLFAIRLIEMILGKFKFIQITIIGVAFMIYTIHSMA